MHLYLYAILHFKLLFLAHLIRHIYASTHQEKNRKIKMGFFQCMCLRATLISIQSGSNFGRYFVFRSVWPLPYYIHTI